ncbi:MAG: metallophosphoesterase [Granulosicoccus sp.]
MNILAVSDLHCDAKATRKIVAESASADVVVAAGDYGIRGKRSVETLAAMIEIDCPVVLVSGNHDSLTEIQEFCKERQSWHLLHGSAVEISSVVFLGIGGEIPKRGQADWNETLSEQQAAELLKVSNKCSVLISHTPPLGFADIQRDGSHEGSAAILEAIVQIEPALCLCGHIHHSWGARAEYGSTLIHNLGPTVNWHTVF